MFYLASNLTSGLSEQRFDHIQGQMAILDANIRDSKKSYGEGDSNFGSNGNRNNRKLPILEYKSISNIDKLGSGKGEYGGWTTRIKNALRGIFGRECAWKFWMEMDTKTIREK